MAAEMQAIVMPWRAHDTVATNRQAAIGRIMNMGWSPATPWVEERITESQKGSQKVLVCVEGHSGVIGNEVVHLAVKKSAFINHPGRHKTKTQGYQESKTNQNVEQPRDKRPDLYPDRRRPSGNLTT